MGSHEACQILFQTSRRNVGLLLRRCGGQGPHLVMKGKPRGFFRVAMGLLTYDGEFRLPLLLAQGSPFFHSSCQGELGGNCPRVTAVQNRPHLGLCPGPNVPLQGRQRSRGCILDAPEESGLISRGRKGLCSALESPRVFLGDH